MRCMLNICNCFSKMTSIPKIIIVGDKGVGKSVLIKDILSGKKISKTLPTICDDIKYIKINKTVYGKSIIKRICKCFIYEETFSIILADTKIQTSVENIPLWYEKIKRNHTNSKIHLVLLNDFTNEHTNTMYNIYHFCSKNNINLVRI